MLTREFRNALCRFATGVTVITTCTPGGEPVGITANSFNSLSLEPPLVLWSLARSAMSSPAFVNSGYFAVHVLGDDQTNLASRFAQRGTDKFAGLELSVGIGGVPLIANAAAVFECATVRRHDGGDHDLFIGSVRKFDYQTKEPLIFFQGVFRNLSNEAAFREPAWVKESVSVHPGSIESLGYL
jgi:3-hydroxy-9,10-secoandrosta-1,3,5(10)-triene-9,17-dione monooxygenase reductase component